MTLEMVSLGDTSSKEQFLKDFIRDYMKQQTPNFILFLASHCDVFSDDLSPMAIFDLLLASVRVKAMVAEGTPRSTLICFNVYIQSPTRDEDAQENWIKNFRKAQYSTIRGAAHVKIWTGCAYCYGRDHPEEACPMIPFSVHSGGHLL